ncbi:MAG: hypothetical protein ACJASM_003067, partial [Salibacteraceae bacterium]
MKPRNKHEIRVHGLCATLPNLTDDHYDYAQKNCFDYHAAESRGFTFCLSCNHKWKRDFNSKGTCPSCEKKIYVLTYKETEYKSEGYMMILDIVEEFQVLRFIHIKRYSHKKKPPFYCHQEVVQKWINPEGRPVIFAKASGGFYADWQDSTDLSIKRVGLQVRQYSISPQAIYPVKKIIKKLKRNGLKSSLHRITPDLLFASLLTDSKSETLLKAKQYWMLSANVHNFRITHEWDSIKICLRNGYLIKDPGMWNDYIGLLRYFGKDLRSSKYVCPVDIQKEHDKLVEKKRNKDRKKKLERQREEVEV